MTTAETVREDTREFIKAGYSLIAKIHLVTSRERWDEPVPEYVRPSMERQQALLRLREAVMWLEKDEEQLMTI